MKLQAVVMLLELTVLLSQQMPPCEGFKVAAFNIQNFGLRKIRDSTFTTALANFICTQEWDIMFLQELTTKWVLDSLRNILNGNSICMDNNLRYESISSDPLPLEGRESIKEIHAYLYHANKVKSFTATIQQGEITEHVGEEMFQANIFFRPPYMASVELDTRNVTEMHCMSKFVLIGMHVRPVRTYSELNGLVQVYNSARNTNKNALILGDFNADCSYFGPVDRRQNILYREKGVFKWLVQDGQKTNTDSTSSCTYDRIIAAGEMMKKCALPQRVRIPQWHQGVGRPKLSDHWPVSIELQCPDSTECASSLQCSPKKKQRTGLASSLQSRKKQRMRSASSLQSRKKQRTGLASSLQSRKKQRTGLASSLQSRKKQRTGLASSLQSRKKQRTGLASSLQSRKKQRTGLASSLQSRKKQRTGLASSLQSRKKQRMRSASSLQSRKRQRTG